MQPVPTTLIRPRFLSPADEERFELCDARATIMDEKWEELSKAWNFGHLKDRADLMGPPELAINALSNIARQLSTPGLYGMRPKSGCREDASWLLEPTDGAADKAGLFSKLAQVQFMALGLGDMFAFCDASEDGERLVPRLVRPHHVEVEVDGREPTCEAVLRELRLRWFEGLQEWHYTWTEYDIRDKSAPKFRVLGEDRHDDVTHLVEPADAGTYRWTYADGAPFIPGQKYFWRDTGEYWHHHDMRGLTRGTLQAALYGTLTAHAAKSASGKAVLAAGIEPMGAEVVTPDGSKAAFRSVPIMPGSILYHGLKAGTTPWAMEIGPGADLQVLAEFTWGYLVQLCQAFGINPGDAMRTSANPTSGVALSIQQRGRREFSQQVEPLFRMNDLALFRKIAACFRTRGRALPETGYTQTYQQIPLDPAERKEQREALEWQKDRGQISAIQEYQSINPGSSREAAVAALLQVAVDEAELAALIAAQAADAAVTGGGPDAPSDADKIADTALNGAQVTAAQGIVASVAAGQLPRATGIAMLIEFFQLDAAAADRVFGTVGDTFTPKPPQDQP